MAIIMTTHPTMSPRTHAMTPVPTIFIASAGFCQSTVCMAVKKDNPPSAITVIAAATINAIMLRIKN